MSYIKKGKKSAKMEVHHGVRKENNIQNYDHMFG